MSTEAVVVEAEAEKAAAARKREYPPAIASPVTTSRAGHTYVDPKDSPRKIKQDKNAINLDKADALFWRGVTAIKSDQFEEALNYLSKALDMRVEYYGERSPECASAYCEYGRALFYKAIDEYVTTSSDDEDENQIEEEEESEEEGDGDEEKKEEVAEAENSDSLNKRKRADDTVGVGNCRDEIGGSSAASDMEKKSQEPLSKNAGEEKSKVEEDGFLEDAPDLDLAWKMLDIAREILEKDKRADVLQIADVVSTLADISLEMEDFDSSLADYFKALSILEGIMDPDSPQIASLCYKICLALDCMDMLTEALNFGRRAVKVLEFHLNRIKSEVKRIDRAICLNRIKTEVKHIDEAASPLKDDDKILPVPTSIEKCLMKRKRSHLHDMRLLSRILVDFKEKVEELEKFMEKDEGPEEREETFTTGNVPSTKKTTSTPKHGTHDDVGGRGNGIEEVMRNSVFGEAARGVKRRCREEEHLTICAKKQCHSEVAYLKAKPDAANKRIKAQSLRIL